MSKEFCKKIAELFNNLESNKMIFNDELNKSSKDYSRAGLKELRQKIQNQLREIKDAIRNEKVGPLYETIEETKDKIEDGLNKRFSEFGSSQRFEISLPEHAKEVTKEHLEAIYELFGKDTFEPFIIPKLADLKNLDNEYMKVMYPKKQWKKDTERGLKSIRSERWDKQMETETVGVTKKGSVLFRESLRGELESEGGNFALIDTTVRPAQYNNNSKYYGSKEGNNPELDPLLPIFQQAFGQDATRFGHSASRFIEKLLPAAERMIRKQFREKGLPVPSFCVMLVPATAFNIQTTLFHPENSQDRCAEWTNTHFRPYSSDVLMIGGNAADLHNIHPSTECIGVGARLAIIFNKKKNLYG